MFFCFHHCFFFHEAPWAVLPSRSLSCNDYSIRIYDLIFSPLFLCMENKQTQGGQGQLNREIKGWMLSGEVPGPLEAFLPHQQLIFWNNCNPLISVSLISLGHLTDLILCSWKDHFWSFIFTSLFVCVFKEIAKQLSGRRKAEWGEGTCPLVNQPSSSLPVFLLPLVICCNSCFIWSCWAEPVARSLHITAPGRCGVCSEGFRVLQPTNSLDIFT